MESYVPSFASRMIRPLSFRHVETIFSVVLTGSVTGAASRLHVTQPAISNILKEAEDRLDFALFERHGGRLVPTRRVELIFSEIERSFTGLDAINDLCVRLHGEERRKVLIASTPAFATAVLPRAIKNYRDNVDDLHFSVVTRSSEYVQALVASRKVDIGFAVEEAALPGVTRELLIRQAMVCLLPPGHPFEQKSVVTVDDLCDQPMISLSRAEHIEDIVMAQFATTSTRPPSVVTCPAAMMVCALVEAGNGFTILDPISTHLFRNSGIIFRPFVPEVHLSLYAYWVQDRHASFEPGKFIQNAARIAEELVLMPKPISP